MRIPLLALHITGGMLGLLSGAVAMSFRKGSAGHVLAGKVFVVSMLTMGGCGSYLAMLKHETGNVVGGLITVYMVATAWLTARRKDKGNDAPGIFDYAALLMALAIGASMYTLGLQAINGNYEDPNVPLFMYFFMGSIPLLAALGDVRMLVRGGISGTPRMVRHLWRMCFGWFIATGSFFLGKQQLFPGVLRKPYFLMPAAVLPLALLVAWVIRMRWPGGIFQGRFQSFKVAKFQSQKPATVHFETLKP